MRRIVSIVLILLLCMGLALPVTAFAASANASLTGPGTVRAGDTITLNFQITGSGISGASGTLSYNTNQLALQGTSQKIGSPWMVEFNGNNFVAYDNNLSNPINGTATIFTVTFQVKSAQAGEAITVSYQNVKASDGNADANIGTVTYSATAAAPLSGNNQLASLNVSNATISPAFSANVTQYTASVPFEVSKLNVTATAADSKAKVSIHSPTLTPNATTNVTVTVTAENGAKKVYTIAVKRAQDPNYVPSGNNDLAGIAVEGFLLSPVFDPAVQNYVIWLPYETTSVVITATPADELASVEVIGGEDLVAGQDNPVKIICTAENGETKEYIVVAKRAAAHGSSGEEEILPEDPLEGEPNDKSPAGFAWWWLVIVGGVALILGAVLGFLVSAVFSRRRRFR